MLLITHRSLLLFVVIEGSLHWEAECSTLSWHRRGDSRWHRRATAAPASERSLLQQAVPSVASHLRKRVRADLPTRHGVVLLCREEGRQEALASGGTTAAAVAAAGAPSEPSCGHRPSLGAPARAQQALTDMLPAPGSALLWGVQKLGRSRCCPDPMVIARWRQGEGIMRGTVVETS